MAMQVQADRAYFHNSRFYGDSSDTLFTGNADNRAFFSSCYINGTYDFLWGVGSAVFVDTTIVGSDNIAAHKGSLVDRNGVLGGCTGSQLLGRSCTAYFMLNCKLPRPKGYRGKSTTLGRCVHVGLGLGLGYTYLQILTDSNVILYTRPSATCVRLKRRRSSPSLKNSTSRGHNGAELKTLIC